MNVSLAGNSCGGNRRACGCVGLQNLMLLFDLPKAEGEQLLSSFAIVWFISFLDFVLLLLKLG